MLKALSKRSLVISAFFMTALFGVAVIYLATPAAHQVTGNDTQGVESWPRYTNDAFGYSIAYPPGSVPADATTSSVTFVLSRLVTGDPYYQAIVEAKKLTSNSVDGWIAHEDMTTDTRGDIYPWTDQYVQIEGGYRATTTLSGIEAIKFGEDCSILSANDPSIFAEIYYVYLNHIGYTFALARDCREAADAPEEMFNAMLRSVQFR